MFVDGRTTFLPCMTPRYVLLPLNELVVCILYILQFTLSRCELTSVKLSTQSSGSYLTSFALTVLFLYSVSLWDEGYNELQLMGFDFQTQVDSSKFGASRKA